MSEDRLDDHPEALLDHVRASGMPVRKWPELQEHLAVCPTCALQIQTPAVTEDCPEDEPADVLLDRLVTENVMWRIRREQRARSMRPAIGSPLRLRFAAILLLCSSSAAAGTWWSARYLKGRSQAAQAPGPSSGGEARAPHLPRSPAAAVAPTVGTLADSSFSGMERGPAEDLPMAVTADAGGGRPSATDPSLHDRRTTISSISGPFRFTAAELFARARSLRLAGDTMGARVVLKRLQHEYPGSTECGISYLIMGRLLLAAGRAESAAWQFGRYLDVGGGAAEEALGGRAAAFARLGLRREEANDWRTLLARYPRTVYGDRARTRLAALAASPATPPPASSSSSSFDGR